MSLSIENILENLPQSPGIYKFKNNSGKLIYIGKAKNLRNRVRNYFQKKSALDLRKQKMVEQITDIEYIEVGSELEAIFLETNLIKKFRPKYNIMMRDDKNYVYIRIDKNEDYPRITTVRRVEKDGALYFGPKTADHKVKKTLELLRKILQFRHCGLDIKFLKAGNPPRTDHEVEVTHKVIKYPCIYYYIRKCAAPCIGKITPDEYKKIIKKVIEFLEGKPDELITEIKNEMMMAAKEQKFEKAAGIRDKLMMVEEIFEKQRISDPNRKDTDIFHYVVDRKKIYTNLFQIREGLIVGQENFIFDSEEMREEVSPSEIIEAFLRDYYEKSTSIPKEIFIPDQIENQEMLEKWLESKKGNRVKILFPLLGEKNHLLELSLKNAASFAHQQKTRWQKTESDEEALENLAQILKISKPPKRIECYDISHIGGTNTVASMIVFANGMPNQSEYRRFKLQTIPHGKPDDYASMREVLTRRLKYLKGSKYSFKKSDKKRYEEILKIIEKENKKENIGTEELKKQNFFCMLDQKKLIGFVRKTELNEIRSLWIHSDYRGQKLGYDLIFNLIEKTKEKKYYVYVKTELREYYENFGFQEVKNIPEDFKKRIEKADLENNDHGILLLIESGKLLTQYKKFSAKPNLIILDGGKGQLSIGIKALRQDKLEIPICALAKEEEEIFTPHEKNSIKLPKDSKTLHLFQRIRDEAHRFAINYSTSSHQKGLISSALDDIPGIGEISKQKLLNTLGTLENIKMIPLDQLARVIGKKAAIKLKQELQK